MLKYTFLALLAFGFAAGGNIILESSCKRDCSHTQPKFCYFNFTLEEYRSMSKACYNCPTNLTDCARPDCIAGDGSDSIIHTINRKLPGEPIEVCLGDSIIVDIKNQIEKQAVTIHWHGILQKDTPYMDGVPMITQCPINLGETFTYNFKPENVGTYWYHSHVGCQRDGVVGALVVRQPKKKDPHGHLYDFDDHIMLLQNWQNSSCDEQKSILFHDVGGPPVTTLLINGKGRSVGFQSQNKTVYTPLSRFVVKKDFRYRFRVISNAVLNCPFEVSIDNHTLTMISSDGADFKPVNVSSFSITAGERYDFVIKANQSGGLFWIKVRGTGFCAVPVLGVEAYQLAVLQYEGASNTDYPSGNVTYDTAIVPGPILNSYDTNGSITVNQIKALTTDKEVLKPIPDVRLFIVDDFYALDNPLVHVKGLYGYNQVNDSKRQSTPQMDHITFKFPSSPLLTQRYQFTPDDFCNTTSVRNKFCNNTNNFCECTHVEQLPLNAVVELVVIDQGIQISNANHPFHMHGHLFRVVGSGPLPTGATEEVFKAMDAAGNITRNLKNAVVKDTVTIRGTGYTIIRVKADNPGYWIFHCHIEIHYAMGMLLVFKVGEDNDMVPTPHFFPTCGDYTLEDEFMMLDEKNKNKFLTETKNNIPH